MAQPVELVGQVSWLGNGLASELVWAGDAIWVALAVTRCETPSGLCASAELCLVTTELWCVEALWLWNLT